VNQQSLTGEKRQVDRLAAEYRSKGYSVVIQPGPKDLPEPLSTYSVDLIAKNMNETVIIEVKSARSLQGDTSVGLLSDAVQKLPGYRFELVTLRSPTSGHSGVKLNSLHELTIQSDVAMELVQKQQLNAAIVVIWAALEGLLRHLGDKTQVDLAKQSPLQIVKTLYSRGIISRDDYDLLNRAAQLRNAVAHGFQSDSIDRSLFERLATFFKSRTERTLNDII
jgi:uncharacterized protein YutE (UPF0331/DUF86 family)